MQALAEVATGQSDGLAVDLNSVTEATLNQDGQLILTGEDGHGMSSWVMRQENIFEFFFALSWEKERALLLNYFSFLCNLVSLEAACFTTESTVCVVSLCVL